MLEAPMVFLPVESFCRVALLKVDGAVFKGVDSLGNKYWERMQDQHGTGGFLPPGIGYRPCLHVICATCYALFTTAIYESLMVQ